MTGYGNVPSSRICAVYEAFTYAESVLNPKVLGTFVGEKKWKTLNELLKTKAKKQGTLLLIRIIKSIYVRSLSST
jgi:hypothetical protein